MHLFGSQPRTLYDLLEVRAPAGGEAARPGSATRHRGRLRPARPALREMLASHEETQPIDPASTPAATTRSTGAISEASHNPVLVHTLQSLNELLLSTVFASVNNLYHRPPQKRQIDRQHARASTRPSASARTRRNGRRANISTASATTCGRSRQEEQRLVRATLRLNGWGDAPPRRRPAAGRTCYPRRLLPPSRSPVMPSNALWLRADQLSSVSPPSSWWLFDEGR